MSFDQFFNPFTVRERARAASTELSQDDRPVPDENFVAGALWLLEVVTPFARRREIAIAYLKKHIFSGKPLPKHELYLIRKSVEKILEEAP